LGGAEFECEISPVGMQVYANGDARAGDTCRHHRGKSDGAGPEDRQCVSGTDVHLHEHRRRTCLDGAT
jgi:hypothetical protein